MKTGEDAAQRRWQELLRVLAIAALLSCSGCMTCALWKGDLVQDFHEPSKPKELAVYEARERRDVLVEYDELSPWNDHPRRRGYFLNENEDRVKLSRTPRFVALAEARGRRPIPVYCEPGPVGDSRSPNDTCAIVATNGNSFTILYVDGQSEATFCLPVYKGTAGNLKLVLLTPATLIVDATIIGGMAGYLWLYGLAHSGTAIGAPRL